MEREHTDTYGKDGSPSRDAVAVLRERLKHKKSEFDDESYQSWSRNFRQLDRLFRRLRYIGQSQGLWPDPPAWLWPAGVLTQAIGAINNPTRRPAEPIFQFVAEMSAVSGGLNGAASAKGFLAARTAKLWRTIQRANAKGSEPAPEAIARWSSPRLV